jgi:hypothetical protein
VGNTSENSSATSRSKTRSSSPIPPEIEKRLNEIWKQAYAARTNEDFASVNQVKLDLCNVYNQPDPRAYYQTLRPLGYQIPQNAKPVFEKVFTRLQQQRGLHDLTVLDLGCSFGINAALLKFGLGMSDLYELYGRAKTAALNSAELAARDQSVFAKRCCKIWLRFVGLDIADKAVTYAKDVGLLDAGISTNFETQPGRCEKVDIVTSTGCVGYVTERTFANVLASQPNGHMPWFASFVLRMFPFDSIAEVLARYGYVTEKLVSTTFVQRRFASSAEQARVIDKIHRLGLETTGKEAGGKYHAEFFLSRPAEEMSVLPLTEILASSMTI